MRLFGIFLPKKKELTPEDEVRDVLKNIVKIISRHDGAACDLWSILSALRGPDFRGSETAGLKQLTTARVRAVIGFSFSEMKGPFFDINPNPLSPEERKLRDNIFEGMVGHFKSHYEWAVQAIENIFSYNLATEIKIKPEVR
jgi:hypothetical protein